MVSEKSILSINNNIRLVKLNDINKNIVTKYFNKIQSKTNKDGDIIETGTHEELLTKGGFYANLYNSQFEKIDDGVA